MTGVICIRPAVIEDAYAINDIYNHYVLNSTCTYQEEPESSESRLSWLKAHGGKYPILVAEHEGDIVGWGSISKYKERSAYRHTVEDSVYVRHDMQGHGIGTSLLGHLLESARANGYHSVIAIVSSDQPASISLHKKFGFVEAAHLREVGYKFDRWLDTRLLQLML